MDEVSEGVRGYKVFNSDWTCRGKQYTCPGKFEEDVKLLICSRGIHFCKKAVDCFTYYDFNPDFHVAEVVAYGRVVERDDKCVTDKLEIVREISWHEVLDLTNTGNNCTGLGNSGDKNSGHRNSGDWNSGHWNSGDWNSGHWNSGDWNSGDRNSGHRNSGDWNNGNRNSGHGNSGHGNSGHGNSGDGNSGDRNSGNRNSGDWNKCSNSNGCFNTIPQPTVYMFNKPSNWGYADWLASRAAFIISMAPCSRTNWVALSAMTDVEKTEHPEAVTVGGFLRKVEVSAAEVNRWWRSLPSNSKEEVLSLPNFDKAIFKEITGIDVDAEWIYD